MLMLMVGLLIFSIIFNLLAIGFSIVIIYKNKDIGLGILLMTISAGMLAWNIVRLLDKFNVFEYIS